jgi:glycosyltransferase involved in cell wall biosynthesis
MKPFISVIVTTYNWPQALTMVLQALAVQTDLNFEVLVADDGSGAETLAVIETFSLHMPVPLKHVWQVDAGFRAAAIRNQALQQASGQYIVFLDGDCIPRSDFVEKHAKLAEAGHFVVGNRVLLSKHFTEDAISRKLPLQQWSFLQWGLARLLGNCNRFLSFLSLPIQAKWRKRWLKKWQGAKGCNLGIFKTDLVAVNGWEERFMGWGYEDSDLVIRLLNAGLARKEGRFALTVIHLWHKENDRGREQENWNLLETTRSSQKVMALQGISQYINNSNIKNADMKSEVASSN